MLYFSAAPYRLETKEEADQVTGVLEFKEWCKGRGLFSDYADPIQFERQVRESLTKFIFGNYALTVPSRPRAKRTRAQTLPARSPIFPLVNEGARGKTSIPGGEIKVVFGPAGGSPPVRVSDDLLLRTKTELTSPAVQQLSSHVGCPTAAINGQVVLWAGNWYAAKSSDGGTTFGYMDPFTSFPNPPNLAFCCNQVVNYISSIDTFVWLLQYGNRKGPWADNIQRLAFAKTADVVAGRWRLFDITTQSLGVKGSLHFPDLAVGAHALYVTANVYASDGQSAGAVVVRIPIAGIESEQVTAQPFVSKDFNSFRVAQNCGGTAFFAAHEDTSTLKVFSWDEGQAAPTSTAVGVHRWIGGSGYESTTPDGRRWLDRIDPRITGATLADSELWFAWSVDGGSNRRPKPFVQIARIDSRKLTLIENSNLFDPDSAVCYPALSTNAKHEVGISFMIGGGLRFPSHVVGILTGKQQEVIAAAGDRGPRPDPVTGQGLWGDYLTSDK